MATEGDEARPRRGSPLLLMPMSVDQQGSSKLRRRMSQKKQKKPLKCDMSGVIWLTIGRSKSPLIEGV